MVQNYDGTAISKLLIGSHMYKYILHWEKLAKTARNV